MAQREGLGLQPMTSSGVVGRSARTIFSSSSKSAATCSGVFLAARSLSPSYSTISRGLIGVDQPRA